MTAPPSSSATPTAGPSSATRRGCQVTDLYIEQGEFHQQFGADVPEEVAAVMAAAQRPVTDAALAEGACAPASVSASHAVSVSRPGDVARLINEAAQAAA